MTKNVIFESETGRVVAFKESPEERAERLRASAEDASGKVRISSGQQRVLARAHKRGDAHP